MFKIENASGQFWGPCTTEPGYGFSETVQPKLFKTEKEAQSVVDLWKKRTGEETRVVEA